MKTPKPFRGASVFTFSDVMMFKYPYSSQIDPLHFVGGVGRVFVDIDIVQFGAHKVILINMY